MAKKTKKQKQRAATRRVVTAPVAGTVARPQATALAAEPIAEEPVELAEEPAVAAVVGAGAAEPAVTRRRIERLNQPAATRQAVRAQRGTTTAAMFRPLENEDAAIPFDRVPYVPADLRRVAIMAVVMVALIIVAAVVVGHIIK